MSNQVIIDSGDLRKYRIELPNLIDDEMDPFQARLYMHYKRVCGGGGSGECWESVRTTATKCKMSTDKVINTRQWLADNNWIHLQQDDKGVYHINIIDRWLDNFTRYAKGGVLNIEQPVRYIEREVFDISNKRKNNSKKEHKEEVEANACNGSASPTPSPAPTENLLFPLQVKELVTNKQTRRTPTPPTVPAPPSPSRNPAAAALSAKNRELLKEFEPKARPIWAAIEKQINALAAGDNPMTPEEYEHVFRALKRDPWWANKPLTPSIVGKQAGAILPHVKNQVTMELNYEW